MSSAPSISAYGVAARPIPSDLDICYRLSILTHVSKKEAIADV